MDYIYVKKCYGCGCKLSVENMVKTLDGHYVCVNCIKKI